MLMNEGHEVFVTASKKDITFELLNDLNIPFENLGSYGSSVLTKLFNVPIMAWRMRKLAKKIKPDLMLGLASSRITHACVMLGIPSIVFTDTEHAWLQILLFRYTATYILTPEFFTRDLGKKHYRYSSIHDLAYLHPDNFKADESVLSKYDLHPDEFYSIIRFVSWKASHDVGAKTISNEEKTRIKENLEKYGKVIVLTEDSEKGNITHVSDIHDLLYFSNLYVGEGGSMATEVACLGIPSYLTNSLEAGVFDVLEKKYGLMKRSLNVNEILSEIKENVEDSEKNQNKEKRNKMLDDLIDPNEFFMSFIKEKIQRSN